MNTSTKRWVSCFVVLATTAAAALGMYNAARADGMIEVTPVRAGSGVQVSIGQCPCFRWTVQVQGLGGRIETKDVLISADALIKFQQSTNSNFQKLASRVVTVGAIEALIKGGHVGVGFNGVTFGQDADRGYSDMLRAGFYALVNILQTDATRFDIRSGYDFERVANMNGMRASRSNIDQAAVFQWNSGPWSGTFNAHVGLNPDGMEYTRLSTGADVRVRAIAFDDFELGLSASVSADHDPFRELLGLNANNAVAMVNMDLSWVAVRKHTND
jgi:hypothetical protein